MSDSLGFIHQFVPGENDRSVPVLLLLHGTGGNENDLLDFGRALYPEAPLLSPRGKILEHGMPRFFRRLEEGVFDEEDLINRTHELADFVQTAAQQYGFAGRKVVAVGYSNGANIAASMLLLRPGVLGGAVLLRAMVPLTPPQLPKLNAVPVFLANGRHDPLIPLENAERLDAMLRQAGANVTLHWSEGGHQLEFADIEAAKRWLQTNFGASGNQ